MAQNIEKYGWSHGVGTLHGNTDCKLCKDKIKVLKGILLSFCFSAFNFDFMFIMLL